MSLEQEIASLVGSTNGLTQEVTNKMAGINAAMIEYKKTLSRRDMNGISNLRDVVAGAFSMNPIESGAFVINTNIRRDSGSMAIVDVKGYAYGKSQLIDFSVVFYAYANVQGNDGKLGAIYNTKVIRRGDFAPNTVWLGIDPITDKISIVFGSAEDTNYVVHLSASAMVMFTIPFEVEKNWSISMSKLPPSSDGKNGFGLTGLIAL